MKVEDNQDNIAKCICGGCPSYDECMKGGTENLYCARGQSTCEFTQKGCTCGQCPLTSEFELSGGYYCNSGQAG